MAITKFSNSTLKTPNRYNDFLAGNSPYDPGGYWPIASAAGTGSSGTVTFSSIPSTYKHLQLRIMSRIDGTGTGDQYGRIRPNGDSSTANYTYHALYGNGSTATADGNATGTYNGVPYSNLRGGNAANLMSVNIVDILDYTSTSKYKTVRLFSGWDTNGSGFVYHISSLWLSTSAISSLDIFHNGANFTTASTFELYGIKEV